MKNHIEERRKARGMTQQQLASELGVSRQNCKWPKRNMIIM